MKIIVHFVITALLITYSLTVYAKEVISCGSSSIEVHVVQEYEDTTALVRVRDRGGRLMVPQIQHPGTFLSLCKNDRFLLIDNSVHYIKTQSFLMSSNGTVVKRLDLGEFVDFGKTDDDELFWTQRFDIIEGRPVTLLTVFDSDGNELLERAFNETTSFDMEKAEKKYQIEVIEPDYPG